MTCSVDHLLIHSATVQRNVPVSDGRGGHTKTLITVATTVPCRVQPANQKEIMLGQQNGQRVTHSLKFLPDADVEVNDIIIAEGLTMEARGRTHPSIRTAFMIVQAEEDQKASGTV